MSAPASSPRKLPGSLENNRMLDRWLRFNADGTVTIFPGKVEIGQGILTVLVQMVADELDIALERVRLAPADTSRSPNEGMTSGSRSIQESGIALRYAAAEVRDLLLQRAAAKLGSSLEQLSVKNGTITARSGGSVTYWELAGDDLLAREATAEVAPKTPELHALVGKAVPRIDIPAKVTGVPSYVQDMELPGMLHGRIARPPGPAARLVCPGYRRSAGDAGRDCSRARRQLCRRRCGARGAGDSRATPDRAQRAVARAVHTAGEQRSALSAAVRIAMMK